MLAHRLDFDFYLYSLVAGQLNGVNLPIEPPLLFKPTVDDTNNKVSANCSLLENFQQLSMMRNS